MCISLSLYLSIYLSIHIYIYIYTCVYQFAIPSGSSDVIFTGSVDLILSTGITQQVFDTLSTALKCLRIILFTSKS